MWGHVGSVIEAAPACGNVGGHVGSVIESAPACGNVGTCWLGD